MALFSYQSTDCHTALNAMDTPLHRARMIVPREQLDALMELLGAMEPAPTSWEDVETGEAWVETYDADRAAVEQRAREMADLATALDGRVHAATVETVASADWTEAWKRFFHTTRISPRIVVRPSWEPYDPRPDDIVVDIDPGMSFGTGLHPTTRACLQFLDRLSGASAPSTACVVDLGCGSGILAIAAAKLGYPKVVALDNDPQAVRIARENLALNGIGPDRVATATADVLRDALPSGEVVVANILACVLVEAAPRIAGAVLRQRPHAALVLSGILDAQFEEVRRAYESLGFRLEDSLLDAGWRTGCFRPVRTTKEPR